MTLLVRDEEDILASHLDFHFSRGVDHVLAMDNCSQDRTADILHSYARSGRLTYIHQPQDDYSQGEWVTAMARQAARELQADWVINSDADEFWWPGQGDLKTALAAAPPEAEAVVVERTNFLPLHRQSAGRDFASAMTLRERCSSTPLGQPLPPKVCHRGLTEVTVTQGNHGALVDGRPLRSAAADLAILHFPVRSYAQFANKIAKGGAAYHRNPALPVTTGITWRRLHELQLRGELEASYDAMVPDPATIAEGLASGALLRDTRLRDALAALARQTTV